MSFGTSSTARLMQFVHYQNKRPNNSLQFWTAFVQEYFEPGAYMRVTLSGNSPADSGTQGTEARSLEAPLEVLPRLFHIKYDSGLKEELLFMSDPQETETPSGRRLLTSTLAVEESVFETLRIKRYGRLVVMLTPAMKIISYDFNMLGYDYSIPQPVILNELGALMHQFQQFQQDTMQANSPNNSKPHEIMQIALTAVSNLGYGFEAEAAKLVEHGYVRRYMRSLQIADVVHSMTDLMHMSQQEPSPIAALQQFHMDMANRRSDQSPESLHSMPTVTSVGLQKSPDDPQHQHQPEQQQQHRSRSHQQAQYQRQQPQAVPVTSQQHSGQHNGLRQMNQSKGPPPPLPASGQGNGHNGPAAQALASPRHSTRSGASAFAQQTQSSGRPPTPRGAKR